MRKGEKIWPLVSIHLDSKSSQAWSLFDLTSLGDLSVTVEPKQKYKVILQCLRFCLQFCHSANYFHASWACAFCLKSHATNTSPTKDKYSSLHQPNSYLLIKDGLCFSPDEDKTRTFAESLWEQCSPFPIPKEVSNNARAFNPANRDFVPPSEVAEILKCLNKN